MLAPALAIATVLSALGCQKGAEAPAPSAPATPSVVTAELPAGTRIPAILMKQLESGIDDEGADVPMIVSEDVTAPSGKVAIKKGTPLQGRVTWSRREDTLSGMMNRPARLKFQFLATVAADGQAVDVCADPAKPEEPFELNRGNTGTDEAAKELDELAKDERNEQVLEAVTDLFDKGDARVFASEESRQRLATIAKRLGMPQLQSVAQQGEVGQIKGLLDSLRQGDSLSRLSPAALHGSMDIVGIMEMAHVARRVNDRLNKVSHGRNIKAYIGTPVVGFVAKAVTVKVTE